MLLVLVGSFDYFSLAKNFLLSWEGTIGILLIGILLDGIGALGAVWESVGAIEASLGLGSIVGLTTKYWVIHLWKK